MNGLVPMKIELSASGNVTSLLSLLVQEIYKCFYTRKLFNRELQKENGMYKQVILVRADLKLPPGKMAAQVAHASVESALKSDKKTMENWRDEGGKKVVLEVANEQDMIELMKTADKNKLKNALITDAGHTVIPAGTKTALGIGPDKEEKIDKVTGHLKIL